MEFFQVIVIVCSVLSPQGDMNLESNVGNDCFAVRDTMGARHGTIQGSYGGLYRTLAECNARREQVLEDAKKLEIFSKGNKTFSSNCPKIIIDN